MSDETRYVAEIAPDSMALARRLLAGTGISDGALAIPRPEAIAAMVAAQLAGMAIAGARIFHQEHCRVCGCTSDRACVPADTGMPCHWTLRPRRGAAGLCSACAPFVEGAH